MFPETMCVEFFVLKTATHAALEERKSYLLTKRLFSLEQGKEV